MKISASIYSNKSENWQQALADLGENGADMIHVDCNDNPDVIHDIEQFRTQTNLPIDLHLITSTPEKYTEALQKAQPEYITLQYEDLKTDPKDFLKSISGSKGLAITSNTPISVFERFRDDFDFVLFMATVPGESGGRFDAQNFAKIREFQRLYPDKNVHVDGGVNDEVSFILRNMGVYASVSGSYLFNAQSMGAAMLNLKSSEVASHFKVRDMMRTLTEIPYVTENSDFQTILKSIEEGRIGVTMVVDTKQKLIGIISNADVRKTLIAHYPNLENITTNDMRNKNPITITQEQTVDDMLNHIKQQPIPIMYMPVVDEKGILVGAVTFMNLIKGEL